MKQIVEQLDVKKVNRLIKKKGLKKKYLAEEMRRHPKTVYAYLRGEKKAPPAMIVLMASVLGVSVKEIAA